jgi:hypothetical protein
MPFSLVLPPPINITITNNTFIRYNNVADGNISIGLVIDIIQEVGYSKVMVRRFLSWYDVQLIAGDSMVPNVAFWPLSSVTNPHYLCDSDLVIEVAANAIIGLAFVFYFEDTKVRHIEGMMHTYIASSYFHSQALTITHTPSFVSFPSLHPQNGMLSCFPSMIFNQLLLVKEKIQLLLNTRSMSEKCICTATVSNIDPHTWYYMTTHTPILCTQKSIVYKKTFLYQDEFCIEKYRTSQYSMEFTLPCHLLLAQNLFGSGIGVGTRKIIKCRLKQRGMSAKAISNYQITYVDTMNIIPFENTSEENIRRGLLIKYIPSEMELSLTVKYRVLTGREKIEPQMEVRNLANRIRPQNPEYDDYYPLFSDTIVFNSNIKQINLIHRSITLANNVQQTIAEILTELDRLL